MVWTLSPTESSINRNLKWSPFIGPISGRFMIRSGFRKPPLMSSSSCLSRRAPCARRGSLWSLSASFASMQGRGLAYHSRTRVPQRLVRPPLFVLAKPPSQATPHFQPVRVVPWPERFNWIGRAGSICFRKSFVLCSLRAWCWPAPR
jgi:hypothetical protein